MFKNMVAAGRHHKFRIDVKCLLMCLLIIILPSSLLATRSPSSTTTTHHHHYENVNFDTTKNTMSLVLPHDTYPGFSIRKMSATPTRRDNASVPFSSFSTSSSSNAQQQQQSSFTLNAEFAKYFTVLENGMLMTTADLTPLVNKPVKLVVVEETPNSTATHQFQLFIMDRKDMLQFSGASFEAFGEVKENQESGTKVQGVPLLQANTHGGHRPITYTITAGNADDAFTLEHSLTHERAQRLTLKSTKKGGGIWLVTARPLDREHRNNYTVFIEAADEDGLDRATSKIVITVLDENDNRPVFRHSDYKFAVAGIKSAEPLADDSGGNSTIVWRRFTSIGHVEATDLDGDKVTYKLLTPNNVVVIVPQTGELLLAGEPDRAEIMLKVEAHDMRQPSLKSERAADVLVEFIAPDPTSVIMQELSHDESYNQHSHRRDKRRVTRAVRPTKRIEFTEADGDAEGKSVFQLEKETDRETFKIRDENPWVTVEPNGAVRVKKKWDYEELGPEKTIDFWVIISNSGQNGEQIFFFNLQFIIFVIYIGAIFYFIFSFVYIWFI